MNNDYNVVFDLFQMTKLLLILYHRDASLKVHTKFLESLGIAGISHHSLLFSKTAPVQVVQDEELTR